MEIFEQRVFMEFAGIVSGTRLRYLDGTFETIEEHASKKLFEHINNTNKNSTFMKDGCKGIVVHFCECSVMVKAHTV